MFGPSIEGGLQHRFEEWHSQRQKTLFGEDAPLKVFLR